MLDNSTIFQMFFMAGVGWSLSIFLKEAVTSIINNLVAYIVMRKQTATFRNLKGEN